MVINGQGLSAEIEPSPRQAAGRVHRNEKKSIFSSLANPAASGGECARYHGSKCGATGGKRVNYQFLHHTLFGRGWIIQLHSRKIRFYFFRYGSYRNGLANT